MTHIVLGVQYVGTHYHGWQRQTNPAKDTIQ
ncbi:MAG: hypothetical protein K0R12_657, partial [Gammaproteobacteria bacterium]|nr:hypothetical protein [Gammaproteobacteria bacterium]